jgi:hypothetical protein
MWQTLFRAGRQNLLALAVVALSNIAFWAHAQNFSDNFTRSTNSASVLPWQIQNGNWVITNGVFRGGPNASDTYGFSYVTNGLTNCAISADFSAVAKVLVGG